MNIGLASTISTIVESQVPRCSRKVAHFGFDYRISKWNEEKEDFDTLWAGSIYFLFARDGNYMKVCTWVDTDHTLALDAPISGDKIWTLQSYHDSCWRSDGFMIFQEILRKVREEHGSDEIDDYLHLDSYNLLDLEQVANVKYFSREGEVRNFVDDRRL